MKFMLLVKASKESEAGVLPDAAFLGAMDAFNNEMIRAGVMLVGEGLKPSSQGARVRSSKGEFTVTEGPLTQAKDLVAGYWVIEAKSKEEALDWAKRAPFEEGEVEVRPMIEMPGDVGIWKQTRPAPGKFRYLSFVMADEQTESGNFTLDPKVMKGIEQLVAEMSQKGVFLGTGGLLPSSHGARVRYFGKKRTVVDGPFAEAKELVGGFALLQASSREEMIEHAKRFSAVDAPGRYQETCNCEVRPLYEASDFQ
jgi:hypothetical protein